jgi:hypothetical protein
VMTKIQQWIDECAKHETCTMATSKTHFVPTRLLYVGVNDTQELRIVSGAEIGRRTKTNYLALSHCWGGEIEFKLTTANVQTVQQHIDANDLPKNFQDAISVTRNLGIRYLWIDSLCILQDSLEDWKKESSAMRQVYANAICVISATASETSNGGCFRQRSPQTPTWSLITSSKTRYFVSTQKPSIKTLFDTRVETAPLAKRCWAFQERLLSRRVVHFCSDSVLFECNTMQASEFDDKGSRYEKLPYVVHDGKIMDWIHETILNRLLSFAGFDRDNYIDRSASRGIRGALDMLQSLGAAADLSLREKIEFNKRWYELVSAYTEGELTIATDKLIALSGIAEVVHTKAKTPYTAGLWSTVCVELGLLWRVRSPGKKQSLYCAPSWSWASVNGRVDLLPRIDFTDATLNERDIIFNVKVEQIKVCYQDKLIVDASSLVDNGLLEITGPVAKVCLSKLRPRLLQLVEGDGGAEKALTFFPDWTDPILEAEDQFLAIHIMTTPSFGIRVQSYGLVCRLKREVDGVLEYERVGVFYATTVLYNSVAGAHSRPWSQHTLRVV